MEDELGERRQRDQQAIAAVQMKANTGLNWIGFHELVDMEVEKEGRINIAEASNFIHIYLLLVPLLYICIFGVSPIASVSLGNLDEYSPVSQTCVRMSSKSSPSACACMRGGGRRSDGVGIHIRQRKRKVSLKKFHLG